MYFQLFVPCVPLPTHHHHCVTNMSQSYFIYTPGPRQGWYILLGRTLLSFLTYPQAKALSLAIRRSTWEESFPPFTATERRVMSWLLASLSYHFIYHTIFYFVIPLSLSFHFFPGNTRVCDWASPNHCCPYIPSPPLRMSLQPKVLEISSGESGYPMSPCPYAPILT